MSGDSNLLKWGFRIDSKMRTTWLSAGKVKCTWLNRDWVRFEMTSRPPVGGA